jgi:hypothetical protein
MVAVERNSCSESRHRYPLYGAATLRVELKRAFSSLSLAPSGEVNWITAWQKLHGVDRNVTQLLDSSRRELMQ